MPHSTYGVSFKPAGNHKQALPRPVDKHPRTCSSSISHSWGLLPKRSLPKHQKTEGRFQLCPRLRIILLHRSGSGVDLPEYWLCCTFRHERFLELGNLAGKPRIGEDWYRMEPFASSCCPSLWPNSKTRQAAHHPLIWELREADPKSGLLQQTYAEGLQKQHSFRQLQ